MKICPQCKKLTLIQVTHFEGKKLPVKYLKCKNNKCGYLSKPIINQY